MAFKDFKNMIGHMTLKEFTGLLGCYFRIWWGVLTLNEKRLHDTAERITAIHDSIKARKLPS